MDERMKEIEEFFLQFPDLTTHDKLTHLGKAIWYGRLLLNRVRELEEGVEKVRKALSSLVGVNVFDRTMQEFYALLDKTRKEGGE